MSAERVILVSNDDGVSSAGLHILAEALSAIGKVVVVAPDRSRSASSHSLTLNYPLYAEEIRRGVFSITGTPTDAVHWAILHLLKDRKPDLVVSGINKGGNLGDDVTYSGTVAAAMEGTVFGVPSIAVSMLSGGDRGAYLFDTAATFMVPLARLVLDEGLPPGVLLNVNVPNIPVPEVKEVCVTALGRRVFDKSKVYEQVNPRGEACYWIGANDTDWHDAGWGKTDRERDNEVVARGAISVTPVSLDLTHYTTIDWLRTWSEVLRDAYGKASSS